MPTLCLSAAPGRGRVGHIGRLRPSSDAGDRHFTGLFTTQVASGTTLSQHRTHRSSPSTPGMRLTLLCLVAATSLGAQQSRPINHAPWALIDAVGYGVLGLGVGLGAAVVSSPNSMVADRGVVGPMLAFTAAGTVAGGIIGSRASRHLDNGVPLTRGHRNAVVLGTVLFGASLGSLAAIPLIAGESESTPIGSDGQAYAICALGGIAVTAIVMAVRPPNIPVRSFRVMPTVVPAREGPRFGLAVTTRLAGTSRSPAAAARSSGRSR